MTSHYRLRGKHNRERKLAVRRRVALQKYLIEQYHEIAKWNKNNDRNKSRINHIIYDHDDNQLIPLHKLNKRSKWKSN